MAALLAARPAQAPSLDQPPVPSEKRPDSVRRTALPGPREGLTNIVSAVDQAAWPIVFADVLGRITFANRAAARLIGLGPDRVALGQGLLFAKPGPAGG